jgi:hypothetical protein
MAAETYCQLSPSFACFAHSYQGIWKISQWELREVW